MVKKMTLEQSDLFFNSALETYNASFPDGDHEEALAKDAREFLEMAGYLYAGITAGDLVEDFLARL